MDKEEITYCINILMERRKLLSRRVILEIETFQESCEEMEVIDAILENINKLLEAQDES